MRPSLPQPNPAVPHPQRSHAARRELWRCSIHHFLNDGYSWALYPILPAIVADFGLTYSGAGTIKATLNLLLSTLGVPFGILAERVGELTVLSLGTGLYGLGISILSLAWSYGAFLGLLLIAGAAGAAFHPIGSSLISKAYPRERTATALGVLNFSGDVGKTVVPLVVGGLAALFDWRIALLAVGLAGVVVSLGLHRFWGPTRLDRPTGGGQDPDVPTETSEHTMSYPAEEVGAPGPDNPWGILHLRGFLALHGVGVLDSIARGGVTVFVPFLLVNKGVAQGSLGVYIALLATGGALGKLFFGPLADRIGKRNAVMATEALTALCIVGFLAAGGLWTIPLLMLLGAFLNGTSSILYALVPHVITQTRRSRGFGIYYSATLIAAGIAPLAFGLVADVSSLTTALYIIAGGLLLSIPLCAWLREDEPTG